MYSRRMGLMGLATAAVLAIGGLAAAGASASPNKAVTTIEARRFNTRRGIFGGGGDFGSHGSARRSAYGWTNRHQQRVSRKKRNQARHRAACKG